VSTTNGGPITSQRRIVVAGGAGFLGSHICEALLARGDAVICVDNLCTGARDNIEHLVEHPSFEFLEQDICTPLDIVGPLYAVLDFACPASPKDFETMPLEILAVSSTGVRNLLELAERSGARFLFTSTSEVYGDPQVHPQPESYWGNVNSIGPRSCYDEAKRFGEALTMAFHRSRGVDVRIVRIFNTYGPRMRPADGRVVINFLVAALANEPITVYGDGLQTRSFCYVDDEVRGLLALVDSDVTVPVNVGNPNEFTVLELAHIVREIVGSSSEIVHLPRPQDDPSLRQPDITRARTLLGWEPEIQLREGLVPMIEWLRTVL
jgi:nucleoside-diphosphate-sugar epimerase